MNDMSLELNATNRVLINAALKVQPGWRDYCKAKGFDLSAFTKADRLEACNHFGVDVAAIIASGEYEYKRQEVEKIPETVKEIEQKALDAALEHQAEKELDQIIEEHLGRDRVAKEAEEFAAQVAEAERATKRSVRLRLEKKEAAKLAAPEALPHVPAHVPNYGQTPDAAAMQLAQLITQMAGNAQPFDAPAFKAEVIHNVGEVMNAKADLIAERCLGHLSDEATRLEAVTMAKVSAALADIQIIRIELKKGQEVRALEGTHHPKFPMLLNALSAKQADGFAPNVWIAGPAGSGKTFAVKMASKALEIAFHYNGAISMPHELLGFIDAGGKYHRTPFREAYEHGGNYLFDEVDGSDNSALLALNAATANGTATFPDGQIERHPECRIIATANTWGLGATAEYVGRSKIDAAFLSRFPVRLSWDYDTKLEQAISGNVEFAKRVQKARAAARKAGIKVLIDPRASIAGAALIAQGLDEDQAAELTYLANLSDEQRRTVEG